MKRYITYPLRKRRRHHRRGIRFSHTGPLDSMTSLFEEAAETEESDAQEREGMRER